MRQRVPAKTCKDVKCEGNKYSYQGEEYKRRSCEYCGETLIDMVVWDVG